MKRFPPAYYGKLYSERMFCWVQDLKKIFYLQKHLQDIIKFKYSHILNSWEQFKHLTFNERQTFHQSLCALTLDSPFMLRISFTQIQKHVTDILKILCFEYNKNWGSAEIKGWVCKTYNADQLETIIGTQNNKKDSSCIDIWRECEKKYGPSSYFNGYHLERIKHG